MRTQLFATSNGLSLSLQVGKNDDGDYRCTVVVAFAVAVFVVFVVFVVWYGGSGSESTGSSGVTITL